MFVFTECSSATTDGESHSNDISIGDKKTKNKNEKQKEVIEVTTDDLESEIKPPDELQEEE